MLGSLVSASWTISSIQLAGRPPPRWRLLAQKRWWARAWWRSGARSRTWSYVNE